MRARVQWRAAAAAGGRGTHVAAKPFIVLMKLVGTKEKAMACAHHSARESAKARRWVVASSNRRYTLHMMNETSPTMSAHALTAGCSHEACPSETAAAIHRAVDVSARQQSAVRSLGAPRAADRRRDDSALVL